MSSLGQVPRLQNHSNVSQRIVRASVWLVSTAHVIWYPCKSVIDDARQAKPYKGLAKGDEVE